MLFLMMKKSAFLWWCELAGGKMWQEERLEVCMHYSPEPTVERRDWRCVCTIPRSQQWKEEPVETWGAEMFHVRMFLRIPSELISMWHSTIVRGRASISQWCVSWAGHSSSRSSECTKYKYFSKDKLFNWNYKEPKENEDRNSQKWISVFNSNKKLLIHLKNFYHCVKIQAFVFFFYREQQTKVSASSMLVQIQTVVALFSESWGNPERFQATVEGLHSAKFLWCTFCE